MGSPSFSKFVVHDAKENHEKKWPREIPGSEKEVRVSSGSLVQ